MSAVKTPWAPWMGKTPMHLDYFRGTMVEVVEKVAAQYPKLEAYEYMGAADPRVRPGSEGPGHPGGRQGHHLHTQRAADRGHVLRGEHGGRHRQHGASSVRLGRDRVLPERFRVRGYADAGSVLCQVSEYPPQHSLSEAPDHRLGEGPLSPLMKLG